MLNLILVIHNHQPLGNLPEVFRKAWELAYQPFLEVIRRHPSIKWALHVSGPLWEWIEAEEKWYFEAVKEELEAGRLELLGGGMWEPIQPIIDARALELQFQQMRSFLFKCFNVIPQGSWTTERVWEPFLAEKLSKCGVNYTLLDDSQLRAGLPSPDEHDVFGYYRTEHEGRSLAIFPIDEKLRYLIPFRKASDVIAHLEERASRLPDGASVTYGDDGEKFGLWPRTHQWVYGEKWLDEFLGRLEESRNIVTIHPSKYLEQFPYARQRVYIPASSYREMGIWTLYPKRNLAAEEIHKWVESNEEIKRVEPPHAAGFFRTYFSRYPESRFMHERVAEIFRTIMSEHPDAQPSNDLNAKPHEKALWHLLRAQCNCAYWHGVFGGLYLNYLRFAVHREILEAENILQNKQTDSISIALSGSRHAKAIQLDVPAQYEFDSENEIIVRTPKIDWVIDPCTAQIVSAGHLDRKVDVIDVLARRFEAYHATMKEPEEATQTESILSIHEIQEYAPPGWRNGYGYDQYRRGCFGARLFAQRPSLHDLASVNYSADMDIDSIPWKTQVSGKSITLNRVDKNWERTSEFVFNAFDGSVQVGYRLLNRSGSVYSGVLLIEFNVGLLAGNSSDRYHLLDNFQRRRLEDFFEVENCSASAIIDEWSRVAVEIKVSEAHWMGVYPVKTLSRSEGGLELTYQGTSVLFSVPVEIRHGETYLIKSSMRISEI